MIAMKDVNHLLIVDDSGTARMIVKQCLEIAGFRGKDFLEAENGSDALVLLQQKPVDIVFADLNMPIMSGQALLQAIKADGQLKSIPVIVITSCSNEARERALRADGAVAVLNKPFSPVALFKSFDTFQ